MLRPRSKLPALSLTLSPEAAVERATAACLNERFLDNREVTVGPGTLAPMDFVIDLVIIGISVGMVYALVALGISLIFSGLDIVHFAHGEIYMIGAFIGLTLFQTAGMPLRARTPAGRDPDRDRRRRDRAAVLPPADQRRRRLHGRRHGHGDRRLRHVDRAAEHRVPGLGAEAAAVPGPFGMPVEIGNLALPMSYVWIVVTALVLMFVLNLHTEEDDDRPRDPRRRPQQGHRLSVRRQRAADDLDDLRHRLRARRRRRRS